MTIQQKLTRSRSDRLISGVCGGLARYFSLDTVLVRGIFVVVGLLSMGSAAILYLAAKQHWPTGLDHMKVDFIRNGIEGNGVARMGNSRWRRLAEQRCGAKSVFHFDVQGSVAKSTHTGLPWLRFLRQQLGGRLHFWPFDGWEPPLGKSVIAEVYPSLCNQDYTNQGVTSHQHDAYCVARWMRQSDLADNLSAFFQPELSSSEIKQAGIEGWKLARRRR